MKFINVIYNHWYNGKEYQFSSKEAILDFERQQNEFKETPLGRYSTLVADLFAFLSATIRSQYKKIDDSRIPELAMRMGV